MLQQNEPIHRDYRNIKISKSNRASLEALIRVGHETLAARGLDALVRMSLFRYAERIFRFSYYHRRATFEEAVSLLPSILRMDGPEASMATIGALNLIAERAVVQYDVASILVPVVSSMVTTPAIRPRPFTLIPMLVRSVATAPARPIVLVPGRDVADTICALLMIREAQGWAIPHTPLKYAQNIDRRAMIVEDNSKLDVDQNWVQAVTLISIPLTHTRKDWPYTELHVDENSVKVQQRAFQSSNGPFTYYGSIGWSPYQSARTDKFKPADAVLKRVDDKEDDDAKSTLEYKLRKAGAIPQTRKCLAVPFRDLAGVRYTELNSNTTSDFAGAISPTDVSGFALLDSALGELKEACVNESQSFEQAIRLLT